MNREILHFMTRGEQSSLPGIYTVGVVTEPPAPELRTEGRAQGSPPNLNDGPSDHADLQG